MGEIGDKGYMGEDEVWVKVLGFSQVLKVSVIS